jgi:hypothetical protein
LDNDAFESVLRFISIPDGKASSTASKADIKENAGKQEKKKEKDKETITTNTVSGTAFPIINKDITKNIKMYEVPDIYGMYT